MDQTAADIIFYKAKIAEQAERFEELVEIMKGVAKQNFDLTVEERNLLSTGYKNVLGARRNALRVMNTIEKGELEAGNDIMMNVIKECRNKVEDELTTMINEILTILEENLIPSATSVENTVFYRKLEGDYYRYLAEYKTNEERESAIKLSEEAYEAAYEMAMKKLIPTHPVRLGVSLNFSVFHYEILKDHEKACQMAKEAFHSAIADLDLMSDEHYNDSPVLLEILKDNLLRWNPPLLVDTGGDPYYDGRVPPPPDDRVRPLFRCGAMILPLLFFMAVTPNKTNFLSAFKWGRK